MLVKPLTPQEAVTLAVPLSEAHWAEHGWGFPLKHDVALYDWLAANERWVCFGVFPNEQEDKLIGFASLSISTTPFNPDVLMAVNEAIYVLPEYRHTMATEALMSTVEGYAQLRKAAYIVWHAQPGSEWEHMLERRGYEARHVNLAKDIRHG